MTFTMTVFTYTVVFLVLVIQNNVQKGETVCKKQVAQINEFTDFKNTFKLGYILSRAGTTG